MNNATPTVWAFTAYPTSPRCDSASRGMLMILRRPQRLVGRYMHPTHAAAWDAERQRTAGRTYAPPGDGLYEEYERGSDEIEPDRLYFPTPTGRWAVVESGAVRFGGVVVGGAE